MRKLLAAFTAVIALVTAVPSLAAAQGQQQGITQQQADEMLKELRAIRKALEGLTQQAPPDPPADKRGRLTDVRGFAMGKPDAPLTMVEFTDLQCPYCNRFTTTTFEELKKQYIDTGLVRFISRDFPLDFHPQAMPAAKATRCAGEQGKYYELRLALLRGASQLSPAFITATATSLKLDMAAFDACQKSNRFDADIQRDIQAARSVGVEGTPSFFVGPTAAGAMDGVLIVGALPFNVIDAKLKELQAALPGAKTGK